MNGCRMIYSMLQQAKPQSRTVKVKVKVILIYLDRNILMSIRDGIGQTPCSLNIFLIRLDSRTTIIRIIAYDLRFPQNGGSYVYERCRFSSNCFGPC